MRASEALPMATTEQRASLKGSLPLGERAIEALLMGCALLTILTTAGILGVLAIETFQFLREVSIAQLLFDSEWTPLFADKHFGIWPLLSGTLLGSRHRQCFTRAQAGPPQSRRPWSLHPRTSSPACCF